MEWFIKLIIVLIILFVLFTLYEIYEHKVIDFHYEEVPLGLHKKVCVISDLHDCPVSEKTYKRIRDEKPDYIFLAGDMINKKTKNYEKGMTVINRLAEIADIYYGLGNHEMTYRANHPALWKEYLKGLPANCYLLDNEEAEIDGLAIHGLTLDRRFYKKFHFYNTENEDLSYYKDKQTELPRIVLAHNPDYVDMYIKALNPDLVISGHCHGGLIRLMNGEGLIFSSPTGPRRAAGMYSVRGSRLLVHRGMGSHSIPLRIHDRCEVIMLEI